MLCTIDSAVAGPFDYWIENYGDVIPCVNKTTCVANGFPEAREEPQQLRVSCLAVEAPILQPGGECALELQSGPVCVCAPLFGRVGVECDEHSSYTFVVLFVFFVAVILHLFMIVKLVQFLLHLNRILPIAQQLKRSGKVAMPSRVRKTLITLCSIMTVVGSMLIDIFHIVVILAPKPIENSGIASYWFLVGMSSFAVGGVSAYLLESLYLIRTVLVSDVTTQGNPERSNRFSNFTASYSAIHHTVVALLIILVLALCTIVFTKSVTVISIYLLLSPYGVIIISTYCIGPILLKRQFKRYFGSDAMSMNNGSQTSGETRTKSRTSSITLRSPEVARLQTSINLVTQVSRKVTFAIGGTFGLMLVSLTLELIRVTGSMLLQAFMRIALLYGLIVIEQGLKSSLNAKITSETQRTYKTGTGLKHFMRTVRGHGSSVKVRDDIAGTKQMISESIAQSSVGSLTDGL